MLKSVKSCDLEYKLKPTLVVVLFHNTGHPLYGKIICMTKIRDTDIINFLRHFYISNAMLIINF